ncbi:MAG TPA: histidine kinase dimerization/phosphoacceptor domain -containing protein [Clostridia bacterium]|nr:histidine kinase dimerization/phosphoacceptor domain -containing protein [Clostridia bacterium]
MLLITIVILLNIRIRESVFTGTSIIAASVSREIETFLQQVDSVGHWITAETDADTKGVDRLQSLLDTTVAVFPAFESLQILDQEGVVLATAPFNSSLIGSNQKNQPFFNTAFRERETVWSNTFISPYTGELTVAVAFPMYPGVLVGHIQLRRLDHIGRQTAVSGKMELIITNSQGNLLVHPNPDYIRQQKNILKTDVVQKTLDGEIGTYETNFEGRQVLSSTSLIETTNWAVVVLQNRKDAFALLHSMLLTLFVLIILSGGLSVVLAFFSRRRLVQPIFRLMDSTRKIAEGNYKSFTQVGKTYREINYLSENLLHMASQIAQREDELKRNLSEKDLLVKEVHHRVKNNLQLVLSILSLKYSSLDEPAVKNAMYDNIGRIYTIAQVHEQLYSSPSLAEIDISLYFHSLVSYLLSLEKYHDYQVRPQLDIEELALNIDQAIPLGIIVFELISNSMQHGFDTTESVSIGLMCRQDGSDIVLGIRDNGSSFDPELFHSAETVGFSIIHQLVKQIDGKIVYEYREGNIFELKFTRV